MRQSSSTFNRWHRVRGWAPGVGGAIARDVVTPPYLLERPCSKNGYRASLTPLMGDEWWRDRRGRLHAVADIERGRAVLRGLQAGAIIAMRSIPLAVRVAMVCALGLAAPSVLGVPGLALAAGNFMRSPAPFELGILGTGSTDTTVALNVGPISFGVSGNASALRIVGNGKTLDSTNFYVTATGGTPSMAVRVRGQTSLKPNNSVLDSLTAQAVSAVGWNKFNTFTGTLTAGTLYYMSLEDGDATNNITILQTHTRLLQSALFDVRTPQIFELFGTNTANGWSTVTNLTTPGVGVHKFSDGSVIGNPISTSSAPSEAQKGLYWIGGPVAALDCFGVIFDTAITAANFSSGQIWTGSNGPTGTAQDESTFAIDNGSNVIGWATNATTYRLNPSTDYRANAKRSVASTQGSRQLTIGTLNDSASADLRLALPYGGNWQWTDETTNAWVNDPDSFPSLLLLLNDQVAVAGTPFGGSMM